MKPHKLIASCMSLAVMLPASSEILLLANGDDSTVRFWSSPAGMSGIVISSQVPSASTSPRLANNLQRAHAWSAYDSQAADSGAPLVFGSVNTAKDRQSAARANVARAQAFRLDFFK